MSVSHPVCLSLCLSAPLSVCLSVCMYVCPSLRCWTDVMFWRAVMPNAVERGGSEEEREGAPERWKAFAAARALTVLHFRVGADHQASLFSAIFLGFFGCFCLFICLLTRMVLPLQRCSLHPTVDCHLLLYLFYGPNHNLGTFIGPWAF